MQIVYPIKLDAPVYISNMNGKRHQTSSITKADLSINTRFFDTQGKHIEVNGNDSSGQNQGNGTRLTNLTGILQGDLLKNCPKCRSTKNQNNFSLKGRTTDKFRDQSYCRECRRK